MKLSRPKNVTFWLAVIIFVVGLLGNIASIQGISAYSFWLVVIGFVILALGNLIKDF